MDSVIDKLTEIEQTASAIVAHAEEEKRRLTESTTSVERNSIRSWRKRPWSGLNGSGRGLRAIRSTC